MNNIPELEAIKQLFLAVRFEARFAQTIIETCDSNKDNQRWLTSYLYYPLSYYYPGSELIQTHIAIAVRTGFAMGAGIWP